MSGLITLLLFAAVGIITAVVKASAAPAQNTSQPPQITPPAKPLSPYYNSRLPARPAVKQALPKNDMSGYTSLEGKSIITSSSTEGQKLATDPENCAMTHPDDQPAEASVQLHVSLNGEQPEMLRNAFIWSEILGKPKAYH